LLLAEVFLNLLFHQNMLVAMAPMSQYYVITISQCLSWPKTRFVWEIQTDITAGNDSVWSGTTTGRCCCETDSEIHACM